jgi:hypothetical protein
MNVTDMGNCYSVQTTIEDVTEKNLGVAVAVGELFAITQNLNISQQEPVRSCTNGRGFPQQRGPIFVVSVGKPSATSLNSLGIREVTQGRSPMDALTVGKPSHISPPSLNTRESTQG